MEVTSLNIGKREKIWVGNNVRETGIYKQPSSASLKVARQGFAEDVVADPGSHGGPDQSVYLYSQEDYDWWTKTLQRELPPGTFGENITLSSFGAAPLKIGDHFQVNAVLLEITFARIPCAKLGARMGDPGFVKQFVQARRPGVYARVLATGELRVGDVVTLIPTSEDHPTAIELYDLWHTRERNPALIQRGLQAPIAERARAAFHSWLDKEVTLKPLDLA